MSLTRKISDEHRKKEIVGSLRFMVLPSEYDGNRKEQSRCRLWSRREARRSGLAIRGKTSVVFGLKSQIAGKVEGKSVIREMNA